MRRSSHSNRRLHRLAKLLTCSLILATCSDVNGIRVYDNESAENAPYVSGSMDILKSRVDVTEFESRYFSIRHRGNYGVRYFWRSPNMNASPATVRKVPESLKGKIQILDEEKNTVLESPSLPTDWGNGTDVLVFSSRDLTRGKKYLVKIVDLDLPDEGSKLSGEIEFDLYYKHYH